MEQTCPICSMSPAKVDQWGLDFIRVQCERCGKFAVSDWVYQALPARLRENPNLAAVMSHIIRRTQRSGSYVLTIKREDLEIYFRERLPTPHEQEGELFLWIGDNQPDNATVAVAPESLLSAWVGTPLAQVPGNTGPLRWLMEEMKNAPGPLRFQHAFEHRTLRAQLTLAGWGHYAALKRARNDSRTAFMAMKFGDTELNRVVNECFRPAVERAGFVLRVMTDQQEAGLIDAQIRAALLAARFVVADLTHDSFNAYWEAGFADGRGLPVIYTCKRTHWVGAKTHFNVNHMTTVLWDSERLKQSEDELVAIIRNTLRSEAKQSDD
jgi:hypothetical protein